jgi:hypothetical protein
MHFHNILILSATAALDLPAISTENPPSGFVEKMYQVNWLSKWVEQESLQFDWTQAGSVETYVVRFFTLIL